MRATTKAYIINAVTNMHPGSGEANFGIVDRQVQLDVTDKLPTVNASGMKGALREFYEHAWGEKDPKVKYVFGAGNKDANKEEKVHAAGQYVFFAARFLVLPVRSSHRPFFRATTLSILNDFIDNLAIFGATAEHAAAKSALQHLQSVTVEEGAPVIFVPDQGVVLEDLPAVNKSADVSAAEALLGENIALFHENDFKDLVEDLPVIARNCLENGISTNLWYEQVLPRESKLYCLISQQDHADEFEQVLLKQPIQIGANASIGYGQAKFHAIASSAAQTA